VPGVVALKDAAGSVELTSDVAAATAGTGLVLLSGDDGLTLPMMAVGARGVVSVVSNLDPAGMVALVRAALAGDYVEARRAHYALLPLIKAAFIEVNPVPAKRALQLMGAWRGGWGAQGTCTAWQPCCCHCSSHNACLPRTRTAHSLTPCAGVIPCADVRLPLVAMLPENDAKVAAALRDAKLVA
jgi:hypothetical protein